MKNYLVNKEKALKMNLKSRGHYSDDSKILINEKEFNSLDKSLSAEELTKTLSAVEISVSAIKELINNKNLTYEQYM